MSQKSKTPARLKTTALALSALLMSAAYDAFVGGANTNAAILALAALAAAAFHEILTERQFAWEDDLAELTPDAETLADVIESATPEVADRLRDATTPDDHGQWTCPNEGCDKTFDTAAKMNGHRASHTDSDGTTNE